jgi:hypothetical protein
VSSDFGADLKDIAIGHNPQYPFSIVAYGVKNDGTLVYQIPDIPTGITDPGAQKIPSTDILVPPSYALSGIDSINSSGRHVLAKKSL